MGRRASDSLDWLTINVLVEEISKSKPDEKKVATLMTRAGLDYQPDPVLRMTTLLDVLNGVEKAGRGQRGRDSEESV